MGLGSVIAAAVAPHVRRGIQEPPQSPGTGPSTYHPANTRPRRSSTSSTSSSSSSSSSSNSSHTRRAAVVSAVVDMARRPLLDRMHASSNSSLGQGYGAVVTESPERVRRDSWLNRVLEEPEAVDEDAVDDDDESDEWDLAEQGYYAGSYTRTIALYALVPLTTILIFVLLALLPGWLWPQHTRDPSTFPAYFPEPLPELLLSASLWCLSHLLRVPLYTFASTILPTGWSTLFFNIAHVLLTLLLRLASIAILRIRNTMQHPFPTWRGPAFIAVWWLALGWALAEAVVGIAQGYEQLALYRHVMVPVERVREILAASKVDADGGVGGSRMASQEYVPLSPRNESFHGNGANGTPERVRLEDAIRLAVDHDVEQLIHIQEREEVEEIYGVPVIYIPVFVPCLQRVNTFLFSLGLTLILAWAYLHSKLSFPADPPAPPAYHNRALLITFPLIAVAHLFVSLLHSPPILPRIGVHTSAYVGFLVGLASVFTGLGLWSALS